MFSLAIGGMPLKWCKWNCYNTDSLSEKLISLTVCVSFFLFFFFFFFFCRVYKFTEITDSTRRNFRNAWTVGRVQINEFWPNFARALLLTIASLGLLKISYALISYALLLMTSSLGLLRRPLSSIHYRILSLEWRQNSVSVRYLENE